MKLMRLWSNAFREGERIPAKYTCDGENINPPLAWDDVPPDTMSFALVADDHDFPMTWESWVIINIDAAAREIPEDFPLSGMKQPSNSAQKAQYYGPCPVGGSHRYYYKLFALDVPSIDFNQDDLNSEIANHTIATAVLMGRYERSISQMKLWSKAFKNGTIIPAKYTCDGENVSPPLIWYNVPEGTKSFALVMDDPDAPAPPFVHWIIINIDPRTREIPENAVPSGARQLINSAEKLQYFGPCPYASNHHYNFRLYALNVPTLVSDENTVFEDIQNAKIAEAELIGRYMKHGVKHTVNSLQ